MSNWVYVFLKGFNIYFIANHLPAGDMTRTLLEHSRITHLSLGHLWMLMKWDATVGSSKSFLRLKSTSKQSVPPMTHLKSARILPLVRMLERNPLCSVARVVRWLVHMKARQQLQGLAKPPNQRRKSSSCLWETFLWRTWEQTDLLQIRGFVATRFHGLLTLSFCRFLTILSRIFPAQDPSQLIKQSPNVSGCKIWLSVNHIPEVDRLEPSEHSWITHLSAD
jgi:hypothetical protein